MTVADAFLERRGDLLPITDVGTQWILSARTWPQVTNLTAPLTWQLNQAVPEGLDGMRPPREFGSVLAVFAHTMAGGSPGRSRRLRIQHPETPLQIETAVCDSARQAAAAWRRDSNEAAASDHLVASEQQ